MNYKELLGALAIVFNVWGFAAYFWSLYRGRTKPHMFSWFLWALVTGILFAAQITEHGGPGAWTTGVSCFICVGIALYALKRGEIGITRSDWFSFIAGLTAIVVWVLTKNPVWSVIIVTIIDVLAFYPTFRKSWHQPNSETSILYFLSGTTYAFAIAALTTYNLTTTLCPAEGVLLNYMFVLMQLYRRYTSNSSSH